MAYTEKGVYYQTDYDEDADILEDMKKMAESIDEAIKNSEQAIDLKKVDKVVDKGLSTEDYTTEEKTKLAGLNNYDDTEMRGVVESQGQAIEENKGDIEALQEKNAKLKQRLSDAENNELTAPVSGEEIKIEDSAGAENRGIKLIGKSWQESITGKNILETTQNYSGSVNKGITATINPDGTLTLDGVATGAVEFKYMLNDDTIELEANQNFMMQSFLLKGTASQIMVAYELNDSVSTFTAESKNLSTSTTTRILKDIRIYINSGITFNNAKIGVMVFKGSSATDKFEKYTGGQASPNPSYPQDIKNTGDNGSVNVKVQNKNYFDYENYTYDKTILSSYRFIEIKNVKPNTRYTIYNYDNSLTGFDNVLFADDTNYSSIRFGTQLKNVTSRDFAVASTGKLYLCAYASSWTEELWNTLINYFKNAMLVEGTDITALYVPHEEQNISFPLSQGQVLAQDDYFADDGIHHVRGQLILDGTENWNCKNVTDDNIHFSSRALDTLIKSENQVPLCTHFSVPEGIWSNDIQGINIVRDLYHLRFRINKKYLSDISTESKAIDSFKSYLAEQYANGTPIKVQYKLDLEQIDPYTSEQQKAWEEIKAIRTYKNVTNISSEDETPATMEMIYVRDLQTYLDNRFNELSSAFVAQGGV